MAEGWADDDFVPPPDPDDVATPEGKGKENPATDDLSDVVDFGGDDFFDDGVVTSTQERPGNVPNDPTASPIRKRVRTEAAESEEDELLLSMVAEIEEEQQKPVKRPEFPGPAGMMPRIQKALDSQPRLAQILSKKTAGFSGSGPNPKRLEESSKEFDLERLLLTNSAWKEMAKDRGEDVLNRFNISYIKNQMKIKGSQIKRTPVLVAALKKMDFTSSDPTCELLDKTGTISGIIHGEVMEKYGAKVQPGSVFVLTNTTVIRTVRNLYVNITLNNISGIYWTNPTPGQPGPGVFREISYRVTDQEILQAAEQLRAEEAQAASRAEQLARQAVAMASQRSPMPPPMRPHRPFHPPGQNLQRPLLRPLLRPLQRPPMRPVQTPRPPVSAEVSSLLEGLDEESLFGEF